MTKIITLLWIDKSPYSWLWKPVNKGKLLLALKERLLGKHFPKQYGGPIQEGRTNEETIKQAIWTKVTVSHLFRDHIRIRLHDRVHSFSIGEGHNLRTSWERRAYLENIPGFWDTCAEAVLRLVGSMESIESLKTFERFETTDPLLLTEPLRLDSDSEWTKSIWPIPQKWICWLMTSIITQAHHRFQLK